MRNRKTREYIKMLAKEHNLSMDTVQKIVESPFQFLRHVMEHKVDRSTFHYPSVRIPYCGVFFCPDYLKERFKKKANESI